MTENGDIAPEGVIEALRELGDLEKDFATVEIDALRQKEYSLKELYEKRQTLLEKIPGFWSTVLPEGPEEIQDVLAPVDAEILAAVKSVNVERYQIKSEREGEPRSLRFTFEFEENDMFEDTQVVKEFEFVTREEGGGLVSKPVTFKWKKDGKKAGLHKLLDLAEDLYKAEDAFADGKKVEPAERESLWQYEKLREEIQKSEEDEADEGSFLQWFGFRGAVNDSPTVKQADGESDDEDDVDIDEDGMLDVEIFPAGEEIAMALAEDLWPNVMDYFIAATAEEDFDLDDLEELEDDEENGDAPKLVEAAEFDGLEDDEEEDGGADARPAKKQRKA